MVPNDLRLSGTYLLCNHNRIHKFRIKWCSRSTPTIEQVHEVMRVTEDIVKSNNLPRRITTGQLKIITKISFWTPRSKALSLRQFRSEKQGQLSAHKHSYVLLVFLADEKEQEDGEHLPTFPFINSEDGQENESQSFNMEKEVVETVDNNNEFIQMDGIQLNTKDADAVIIENKLVCQNLAHTMKSAEVILDKYDGEHQHFAITNETEHNFVSRIEKLVERAVMAAKVNQNQAMIFGHNNEQDASKAAIESIKTEVVGCNSSTDPTVELHHDLVSGHKETISSVDASKDSSFPIMDSGTESQDEKISTHDKCVKHSSPPTEFAAAHLPVVTSQWKIGNIKGSTDKNLERYHARKAAIHKKCPACNVHIHKDCKEENLVIKAQACEVPLTVSSYSTLSQGNSIRNYKLPNNMSTCDEITSDVAIRRKRCRKRNASDICKVPSKKQMITGGVSPVILGPTSFQAFGPYHTGVMSEHNALKIFENIIGGIEGRNGIKSSLPNLGGKLEKWLTYQSIISRLRALPRINNETELREILRYIIRNLKNRNANMAFTQQSKSLVCSTPEFWIPDTHYEANVKRALIMASEENQSIMQDMSKGSGQTALGKIGAGCYKNSSVVHIKSDSADNQYTTCEPSRKQEQRAFITTINIKQEPVEENNSLQDKHHSSKICEPTIEHNDELSNVQNVKVGASGAENNQLLKAEKVEKPRHLVKCLASHENVAKNKDKFEVEPNGVVRVFNFGDDFSGIVMSSCSPVKEDVHLVKVKRPVQVHYDEIYIPNISYCRTSHSHATNTVKQNENISCSSDSVLFRRDNSLVTVAEHSLAKPTTNSTCDVSSKEILDAAQKLAALKELRTISSIRTLRKTLTQQGVLKVMEETKLSSSVYPKCSVPICRQDFSGQHFNSCLNNTHKISAKQRSRTDKSFPDSYNTLDRFKHSFDTNVISTPDTAGSLPEICSSVLEDPVTNGCHTNNCSQNCKSQSFRRKRSSKKLFLLDPIVPPTHSKTTEAARPMRVKVGKLLSCANTQIFLITEINASTDCSYRFSDRKPHNLSPKSQKSLIVESDFITAFLQYMACKASQKVCLTSSQSIIAKQSFRDNVTKRNKLFATPPFSPIDCVVNSDKILQSQSHNFLKTSYSSIETTTGSVSSSFSHCKCPPSVKFQGACASYSVMSSQRKTTGPRRQLIDMIHNIKSNVNNRMNICDKQHCFYFHVDKEESVEGFYATVEKYCSALSKFHSHQHSLSKGIETLLRDIWLPGQKHSISFYVNLPLQKCKCNYCGLDTTVELCLNCGELFECTELGNYVLFENPKTPEHVDMEMDEAATTYLNLINDLYLCKPLVVMQKIGISVSKQSRARKRKKPEHLCCRV